MRALLASTALLLVACAGETAPVIRAAEGGSITTSDGVMTLYFPPGALGHDTAITITPLLDDEWPVGAPGRFERIGGVYRVEPGGLELDEDAYAIVIPPDPSALRDPEGDLLAMHYLWSPRDEHVRAAPATRTLHLADGRVAIVATLWELGTHWTGDRVPGADRALPALHARIEASAGDHPADQPWSMSTVSLVSDLPHAVFRRDVSTTVVFTGAASPFVPAGVEGASVRSWDATHDAELGLHPWEVFALGGARTETRSTTTDTEPVALSAGTALSPLVTPLPGWRCGAASDEGADAWVAIDVVTGASSGVVTVGAMREIGTAHCR